jgi:BirA family transcriptional regulator, biotin operon repressor / biotin---[acetyl-CoA-carboxylase] ligase
MASNQPIGKKILFLPETDSTNLYAMKLIRQNVAEHGMFIRTDFQTRGKGYMTNKWVSDKGENLLCSIILFPEQLSPEKQFYLSKFTSLALSDYLKSYDTDFIIKWPNDICHGDNKIAGILIENGFTGSSFAYSIIGIGINLNQRTFDVSLPNPVSLANLTGLEFDQEEETSKLLKHLNFYYNLVENGEFGKIDRLYSEQLYLINQPSRFMTIHGEITGTIRGVDQFGRLTLETEQGEALVFGFKEIAYLFRPV